MARLARLCARRLPVDQPPYRLDPSLYHRFDQRNNMTVGRPTWDEPVRALNRRAGETRIRRIRSGDEGFAIQDYALNHAAGVAAYQFGANINQSNRGLLSWTPSEAHMYPGAEPWSGSQPEATALIKRAARFFGADLVGIATLNPLWFFSHAFWSNGAHKEIVFADAAAAAEDEHRLTIPSSMRWVVVMGKRMDREIIAHTPAPTGCAETSRAYSSMVVLASTLAEFVRAIGYQAIPSVNDLAQNIPLAIDAGLGEQGRHGKLITPEFGPSVRLCKVVTDLPLAADRPISLGVGRFCETCMKCARECPSHSISDGPRTWSGPNVSNNAGVFTWHLDNETCRKYWNLALGDNCTVCIRVCPFTKGPGLVHDLARAAVAGLPALNPVLIRLDDALGYGRQRPASQFWNAET